ncbi:hypothetical protein AS850_06105 [Frondihabitans sp. 762G35]|uniref:DUF2254 domain-containing protein n=1 Tax=Frondihabitans sp. 762G35 TaxID=1446794 RepID=UPI000D202A9C|nr:DUF2254 domain-containing protein [Frondihabitans sp. 762G35]ARC56645.1 hypothetical protein AS850_06105 [Frondihabitans sp. 762G35]
MRSFLLRARESFWFLPAVFGLLSIVLAEALVAVDRVLIDDGTRVAFLDALSASAARSILSSIGTSMLTVAGTSFSITISVLATTSSTYGPRLVRNFLADRANQLVLAVFTSTFLYALVVLRSVRSESDGGSGFVPTIAVHTAVLIGILDVAVLVFFIHHIADSVQISTLQKRVQADLIGAIDSVYPARPDGRTVDAVDIDSTDTAAVATESDGYVQHVDLVGLRRAATRAGCVLDVAAMPGEFVIPGDPLVRVRPADRAADVAGSVKSAITIGTGRTPHQDVRFALQQLVEIAVRGLASGTNDPYTAVTALDLAGTALVPLMTRPAAATTLADEDGTVRVNLHWPAPDDLLQDLFEGVAVYGLDHPLVVDAARRLAGRLRQSASGSTATVLDRALDTLH